jgi:hypothetical protein
MEHFARSWFWRTVAVGCVCGLVYVGWGLAGERTTLPIAEAGGVFGQARSGYVYTTNEAGDVLYAWPTVAQQPYSRLERWSWADGSVLYRSIQIPQAVPGQPGVPYDPYDRNRLPPKPEPGSGR